ncbi:hypothetical protein ACFW15_26610, partial [Streptomyces sp. NPDC058953]
MTLRAIIWDVDDTIFDYAGADVAGIRAHLRTPGPRARRHTPPPAPRRRAPRPHHPHAPGPPRR